MTRMSYERQWTVYIVHEHGAADGPVKIGTANNLAYRLASLRNGNWRRLVVAAQWNVGSRAEALRVERHVLKALGEARIGVRDWLMCSAQEVVEAVKASGPNGTRMGT